MKRDMALIKAILKFVECNGTGADSPLTLPEFPQYTDEQVQYHATLCVQAGYIEHVGSQAGVFPTLLTWDGHEALDRMR